MEIWKPLKNFPSYNCSSEGRIMNIKTQRILKTFIDKDGYRLVCLRKNNQQYTVKVGKIIAETFLGEQPGMVVSYKNGDGADCCIGNLVWRTKQESILAAFERGGRVAPRQISVRVIETGDCYESLRACAREIGCSQTDISQYLAGRRASVKGYHFERT